MARSTGKAQTVEMNWDGSRYTTTLTDTNGVLSDYTFSSEQAGINFTTRGNTLTITAEAAPTKPLICDQCGRRLRTDQIRFGAGAVYQPLSEGYKAVSADDDEARRGRVRRR